MPIKNAADRWGFISIGIHWLTVVLVLSLAFVGLLMDELSNSPTKVQVYALHKSFGLTVLGLTVLRLLWRLFAGVPQPVPGTPRWQVLAASLSHGALYVVLLAMPLSGWLYNSASGFPLKWFGLFSLPKLSGWTATERLKGDPETQGIPVVAFTANVLVQDRRRALEVGCDGFVAKPVHPMVVVEEIRRVLGRIGGMSRNE